MARGDDDEATAPRRRTRRWRAKIAAALRRGARKLPPDARITWLGGENPLPPHTAKWRRVEAVRRMSGQTMQVIVSSGAAKFSTVRFCLRTGLATATSEEALSSPRGSLKITAPGNQQQKEKAT
jgi:hypothetical protein